MEVFKAKSITDNFSDREIGSGCHTKRFISFESILIDFRRNYNISDKAIGYVVTDQGVELVYD